MMLCATVWAAAVLAIVTLPAAAAQAPGCSLPLGSVGQEVNFARCLTIDGVGDNFVLYWTQNGTSTTWGLSTASNGGYVSFAFPEEPGEMIRATAFSLQACDACATGAELRQWYLAGFATGDMQLSTALPYLSGPVAAAAPGAGMAATFSLPVGGSLASLPLIFAAGAVYEDGSMRYHEQYGSGTLDLTTGTLSDVDTGSDAISALVAAHLWLLLLGWGVFIPLGVVIARVMKERDPLWFQLHRALQSLGLLMGIIGFALGFKIAGGWNTRFLVHRNLGMSATILGLVQLPALRWRPTLTSPYRRLFNVCHWYIGRVAVVLAVSNIYYGMINILDVASGAWAAYTAVLGVIVGLAVLKESYMYCRLPPPGLSNNPIGASSSPTAHAAHNGTVNGTFAHAK